MANFNLNKVILGGNLTADPEIKQTPSGVAVTTFTIAVRRRFQSKNTEDSQTDFISVTAWRQTAEFITRYFRKGSSICIVGSIQTRSWTDQQGTKRYATDVVADEAYFVDSKSDSSSSFGAAPAYVPETYGVPSYSSMPQAQSSAPKFEEITDDDDLPF